MWVITLVIVCTYLITYAKKTQNKTKQKETAHSVNNYRSMLVHLPNAYLLYFLYLLSHFFLTFMEGEYKVITVPVSYVK